MVWQKYRLSSPHLLPDIFMHTACQFKFSIVFAKIRCITQLAKMSIDSYFIELAADVFIAVSGFVFVFLNKKNPPIICILRTTTA